MGVPNGAYGSTLAHCCPITWLREWRSFKNSARTDGLELGHWVKANTDPNAGMSSLISYSHSSIYSSPLEYPFARYNAKSADYTYSQDEYTKLLEGEGSTILGDITLTSLADPEWSKEETDYLFSLIREYDSRFYIVADRYEFATGPPRSMEVSYVRVLLSTRL